MIINLLKEKFFSEANLIEYILRKLLKKTKILKFR